MSQTEPSNQKNWQVNQLIQRLKNVDVLDGVSLQSNEEGSNTDSGRGPSEVDGLMPVDLHSTVRHSPSVPPHSHNVGAVPTVTVVPIKQCLAPDTNRLVNHIGKSAMKKPFGTCFENDKSPRVIGARVKQSYSFKLNFHWIDFAVVHQIYNFLQAGQNVVRQIRSNIEELAYTLYKSVFWWSDYPWTVPQTLPGDKIHSTTVSAIIKLFVPLCEVLIYLLTFDWLSERDPISTECD